MAALEQQALVQCSQGMQDPSRMLPLVAGMSALMGSGTGSNADYGEKALATILQNNKLVCTPSCHHTIRQLAALCEVVDVPPHNLANSGRI